MKVIDLIEKVQAFDPNTDVSVQIENRTFASPVWIGVMNTAGLFDERKEFRLVISAWQPEDHLKARAEPQQEWRSVQRSQSSECSSEAEPGATSQDALARVEDKVDAQSNGKKY